MHYEIQINCWKHVSPSMRGKNWKNKEKKKSIEITHVLDIFNKIV